jgi:hypothetical protein
VERLLVIPSVIADVVLVRIVTFRPFAALGPALWTTVVTVVLPLLAPLEAVWVRLRSAVPLASARAPEVYNTPAASPPATTAAAATTLTPLIIPLYPFCLCCGHVGA